MKSLAMSAAFAALACATMVAAATPSQAASFNCYGRLTVTEAVICQNPGLSSMDSQMASQYYSTLNSLPRGARSSLRGEQLGWLRARNGCGANVGCLATMYRQRMGDLQNNY